MDDTDYMQYPGPNDNIIFFSEDNILIYMRNISDIRGVILHCVTKNCEFALIWYPVRPGSVSVANDKCLCLLVIRVAHKHSNCRPLSGGEP